MPTQTLSAEFVRTVPVPEKGKVDYYDTAIINFILEVRHTGGKTFSLRYRDPHGKQRQHKIGDAASISFDKARQAAQVLRSRVVLGESPSEERKIKRAIPTVSQLAERYLTFVKSYKKSWDSDDSYLRNHILPKFGSMHLDEVTQQAVIELQHSMLAQGYAIATSQRIVILVRYMFNLALKWRIPGAENNPTSGVQIRDPQNARERFLTTAETQKLRAALEHSDNTQLRYIVPLLLLTGARKRELLESKWEHFDIERRTWRIPTTKAGKPRHVPLSAAVIAILAQAPRFKDCPYVVPNPKTKLPYQSIYYSWNTARKQAGLPDVRCHDLRHSMASNMVNSGRSIYEVAKVLGHTQLKTTQRYSHLNQETLLAAVDASANAAGSGWGAVTGAQCATAQRTEAGDNLVPAAV